MSLGPGPGTGYPRDARGRVLDPLAIGPSFYTPEQKAWLNNAKAWGYNDPTLPGHSLALQTHDDTGAEYRDLIADGVGWRDPLPDGTPGPVPAGRLF